MALAMAVIASAGVLGAWRLCPARLVRRELIGAAHYDINTGGVADKLFAPSLNNYARLLGYEIREGEDGPAFTRRVFGVTDVYPTGYATEREPVCHGRASLAASNPACAVANSRLQRATRAVAVTARFVHDVCRVLTQALTRAFYLGTRPAPS